MTTFALVRLQRVSRAELYTHVCPEYVPTDGERVVQPQALHKRLDLNQIKELMVE